MINSKLKTRLSFLICIQLVIFYGCGGGGDDIQTIISPEVVEPVITATDLSSTIAENPTAGVVLGTVEASVTQGILEYIIVSQSNVGALAIKASNGEVTVADASLFDFETIESLTALIRVSAGSLFEDITVTVSITDVEEDAVIYSVWEGISITFTKDDGGDPTSSSQQDYITDNVKITRGNNGGQIYNIVTESSADRDASPADTEWALGKIDQIADLTFKPFRAATNGKPKNIVGQNMVLHLITDDVYLSIKITSWATQKGGGFSYERSTGSTESSKS